MPISNPGGWMPGVSISVTLPMPGRKHWRRGQDCRNEEHDPPPPEDLHAPPDAAPGITPGLVHGSRLDGSEYAARRDHGGPPDCSSVVDQVDRGFRHCRSGRSGPGGGLPAGVLLYPGCCRDRPVPCPGTVAVRADLRSTIDDRDRWSIRYPPCPVNRRRPGILRGYQLL